MLCPDINLLTNILQIIWQDRTNGKAIVSEQIYQYNAKGISI